MYKFNDLTEKRFEKLTAIEQAGRSKDRHILWKCKCDCGNIVLVSGHDLVSGHTKSCGCLQKERTSEIRYKHGDRDARLYSVWKLPEGVSDNSAVSAEPYQYGNRSAEERKDNRMKTLDEVIKALEWCVDDSHDDCDGCPYDTGEVTDCHERNIDALHYLKECKAYRDRLTSGTAQTIICPRCHSEMGIFLPEGNDPLTWDELKQMEGKPVWIEGKTVKHWAVIAGIYYDDLNEGYLLETYYAEKQGSNTSRRKRSTLGKTWNAYRKERE